jgi:hypothetical protein
MLLLGILMLFKLTHTKKSSARFCTEKLMLPVLFTAGSWNSLLKRFHFFPCFKD